MLEVRPSATSAAHPARLHAVRRCAAASSWIGFTDGGGGAAAGGGAEVGWDAEPNDHRCTCGAGVPTGAGAAGCGVAPNDHVCAFG